MTAPPDDSADVRRDVVSGRVTRIDRGWSTVLADDETVHRVRNIGADVAVGDRVELSDDLERIAAIAPRRSELVRRMSYEGARARSQVIAANIDIIFIVHSATAPANRHRLERELVLAHDSGARPVLLVNKTDAAAPDVVDGVVAELSKAALDVEVCRISALTGSGLDGIRALAGPGRTVALLGASGVGKSTLVNALVGREAQRTGDVRDQDQRGRHTTVAAELVALPGGGWLCDTPGLRAVSLWISDKGLERAFPDVFDLAEDCRFRNCRHADEPGCAVQAAIADGRLDAQRLWSLRALVDEEARVEEEIEDAQRRESSRRRRG
jgi:ribosome biogenesis GTPase